ncbi:MAG: DUF4838 domain-containing protein [Muribaculaceae bacterium]|nr:DUF4838 domain-containing protein [Muribaculaceae bacterium]
MINKRNIFFISVVLGILLSPSCTPARPVEQETNAFGYREVFLPQGIGKNAKDHDLNSIDVDWGIWGHNLGKVLPEKHSESVYAKVNESTLKSQYCFSSNRLYDYITQYIDDNYSSTDHTRFSIIPNDNDIVCLCVKCVAAGNTEEDASPAVFNMVKKLASRYPNHQFYTSDYRTTRDLPTDSLPPNAGVMVSAMPYPFSLTPSTAKDQFLTTIDDWGAKTDNILIWDYINNFDDYFTPYPNLGVMQDRLRNYRDHNVSAVFLNGSGSDASSFSNLKTIVFADLLKNPDNNWEILLVEKAKELYPVTGETIANFMLAQEKYVKENNVSLPMYEGVAVAERTYLPLHLFLNFHDSLLMLRDKTVDGERAYIDKLLPKLAMTRLELKRLERNLSDTEPLLESMENLKNLKVTSYNEAGWQVENYIKDYRFMLNHYKEMEGKNLLKGETLAVLTPLDPDYRDVSILTDGLLGMPSNYHNGHLINSPEKKTDISIPYKPGATKLRVWLSYIPGYRIYLPESVSLSATGMDKVTVNTSYPKDYVGHYPVEFQLPSTIKGPLTLTLVKDPEKHSMAIEEIEME